MKNENMKNLNLKSVLITVGLMLLIFMLLNKISYSTIPDNLSISKIEYVDSSYIYYQKTKELEASIIINDRNFAPSMNQEELKELLIYLDSICIEFDVEYEYVKAIIANESRWNQNAVGLTKDYGLMQMTPIASKDIGMQHGDILFDAKYNILSGVMLLAKLKESFNTMEEVLVAYNAGSGNVRKYGNEWVQKHKYLKGINKWLDHDKLV